MGDIVCCVFRGLCFVWFRFHLRTDGSNRDELTSFFKRDVGFLKSSEIPFEIIISEGFCRSNDS
jgi:hypothetical protein